MAHELDDQQIDWHNKSGGQKYRDDTILFI